MPVSRAVCRASGRVRHRSRGPNILDRPQCGPHGPLRAARASILALLADHCWEVTLSARTAADTQLCSQQPASSVAAERLTTVM